MREPHTSSCAKARYHPSADCTCRPKLGSRITIETSRVPGWRDFTRPVLEAVITVAIVAAALGLVVAIWGP